MTLQQSSSASSPEILEHDLQRYFPKLLKFESTPEMEASAIYAEIKLEVERILNAVVTEDMSVPPAVAGGLTRHAVNLTE